MSLSLFNELRPLYDPFLNPYENRVTQHRPHHRQGVNNFFSTLRQPAVDVSEEDHRYIIEAEIPGVKKENISIFIGDNGRSVTIEGRDFAKSSVGEAQSKESVTPATPSNETALQKTSPSEYLLYHSTIHEIF